MRLYMVFISFALSLAFSYVQNVHSHAYLVHYIYFHVFLMLRPALSNNVHTSTRMFISVVF